MARGLEQFVPLNTGTTLDLADLHVSRAGYRLRVTFRADGEPVPESLVGVWNPGVRPRELVKGFTSTDGVVTLDATDLDADATTAMFCGTPVNDRDIWFPPQRVQPKAWTTTEVTIDVRKSARSTTLRFVEHDGSPVAGARVLLLPASPELWWSPFGGGWTDQGGTVALERVAVGEWRVAVQVPESAPVVLPLTIEPSGSQEVELRLPKRVTQQMRIDWAFGDVGLEAYRAMLMQMTRGRGAPPVGVYLIPADRELPPSCMPAALTSWEALANPIRVQGVVPGRYRIGVCQVALMRGADEQAPPEGRAIVCERLGFVNGPAERIWPVAGSPALLLSAPIEIPADAGAPLRVSVAEDVQTALDRSAAMPPYRRLSAKLAQAVFDALSRRKG